MSGKKTVLKTGNEAQSDLRKRIVEGINLRKRVAASSNLDPHCLLPCFNKIEEGNNSTPPIQAKCGEIPVIDNISEDRMSCNDKYVSNPFRSGKDSVHNQIIPGNGQMTAQQASSSSQGELKTPTMSRDPYFKCRFCKMPIEIWADRKTHEDYCLIRELDFLEPNMVNGFL